LFFRAQAGFFSKNGSKIVSFFFALPKKETKNAIPRLFFAFSFVLIQKKQKIKSPNPRRSNLFSNAKRKKLGLQPQTAFLFTHSSNI
jgi:hypothetical protein